MDKLRRIILYLVLTALFVWYIPSSVTAHIPGQPPYFKINNKLADFYPVPPPPFATFDIPQDLAPEMYTVNQKLNFEIDNTVLQIPDEIINEILFIWEYGDGATSEGLINSHTYTKAGSYILKITSDMSAIDASAKPQLFQSVMIHVLQDSSYKLPAAQIIANGIQPKNPLIDILDIKPESKITLDASPSKPGSSKIKSYAWTFGDGDYADGSKATHSYKSNWPIAFPILRVTDENGFISDTFVTFRQKPGVTITPDTNRVKTGQTVLPFIFIGGIITLVFGFLLIAILKK